MRKIKQNNKVHFKDNAIKTISFEDKVEIHDGKVISIRDGVMEYMGAEIGQEPASKIFTVYRSPSEVKRIAKMIVGIPITDGHIEPHGDISESIKQGEVKTFSFVDAEENELNSTLAVEHDINLSESMLKYVQDQKPESSLGYTGKLVPHKDYDFEQVGLSPHHLAVVTAGRCGEICKFKDGKVDMFLNEDGTLNLKAFVEAVKSVMEKADDTQKAEISGSFGDMFGASEKEEITDMENEEASDDKKEETEIKDEDDADKKEDDFKDEASIGADAVNAFKDSDEFKKVIEASANERAEIISKATTFLDSNYAFAGKPTCEIMKDALTAEFKDETFTKEEVPVAFKMLEVKQNTELKNFGDNGIDPLTEVFGKAK